MSAEKVIQTALAEVGYLEKVSNLYLDSKTANAGRNNYNKYARDIWPALQAQPWCDIFVSWCAQQAGEAAAVGKYAYCPSHVSFFRAKGQWYARGTVTPKPGDIIFFQSGGEACHVGIVQYVSGNTVHTIEGNTSGTTGLIDNGGGVAQKAYSLSSSYILGYGRPDYSGDRSGNTQNKELKVYSPWKTYRNGSTPEPVYKNTDRTIQTGTLNAGEECWCTGRYGDSYCVIYKLDGTADDWAVGYVAYSGGITE